MMRRILAGLACWLGTLTLLCTPAGATQSVAAVARRAAMAPEAWHTAPQAGMLLVATRELRDPLFSHAVILLLSHGIAGSQGLIVNQRSQWQLSDLLAGLDAGADEHPVFFGGPLGVHQVFVLLRAGDSVPGAQQVGKDMWFSDSRSVLDELLSDPVPAEDLRFYVGYASWTTGQLAMEIARGSWLLVRGDTGIVFNPAGGGLWERLIEELQPDGILVSREPSQRTRQVRSPVAVRQILKSDDPFLPKNNGDNREDQNNPRYLHE
jgi:putative transcriptional regulator